MVDALLLFPLFACTAADAPATGNDSGLNSDSNAGNDSGEPDVPAQPLLQFTGDRPKNVLMLSIDTLARHRVGRYAGNDVSPTLDRLASEGFSFEAHRSCSSWTYPSVGCVLTGRANHEMGFVPFLSPDGPEAMTKMPLELVLFPEVFAAAGYDTRLRSTNDYLSALFQTDQGYADSFLKDDTEDARVGVVAIKDIATLVEPFLVHVHMLEPHSPLNPPTEYYSAEMETVAEVPWDLTTLGGRQAMRNAWETLDESTKAAALRRTELLYDAEIRYTDAQLQAVLRAYEVAGLLENTLVVVWSDHGEQMYEHGSLGHAGTLYREENDAIATFWAKNLVPGTSTVPSTHADLAPTLLDALGLNVPAEMTGRVLGMEPDEPVFSVLHPNTGQPASAVEWQGYKLIYAWSGRGQLFNRDVDPAELTDLYQDEPAVAQELWNMLAPIVAKEAELIPVVPVPLTF